MAAFAAHYQDGVLEGELLEWDEGGAPLSVKRYNRGLLNGERGQPALTLYHPNQNVREVADFFHGQPTGTQVRYLPNGRRAIKLPSKRG